MAIGLPITRHDLDAAGLRRAARSSLDANASRRMLALALVLEGSNRTQAALACAMDRQTLRDWVHRYNAQGLAGLRDRVSPGPVSKLTAAQLAQLSDWVRAGPDLARDGVVRWRRCDLAAKVAAEFKVTLAERSIGKILHRLNFRHLSARPRNPKAKPEDQEAHKKTSQRW